MPAQRYRRQCSRQVYLLEACVTVELSATHFLKAGALLVLFIYLFSLKTRCYYIPQAGFKVSVSGVLGLQACATALGFRGLF